MPTEFWLLLFAVALFAIQLLLCLKVKKLIWRLLPTVLAFTVTVTFFVMTFLSKGWDVIGYLLLAVCSLALLVACGIAWGVWAMWLLFKKVKEQKDRLS